ncbi:MAG: hypothetical protein ACXVB1_14920 [Pseudobdellovibrionaceae bacterium]
MTNFKFFMGTSLLVLLTLTGSQNTYGYISPDFEKTPGKLCATTDSDFKGVDYPEQIPRCNRNIELQEKEKVAAEYGDIPRQDWRNYEFDHLIPLCAGGSNDFSNLWPQPIDEAKEKDVLEVEICTGMRNGTLKQADAVQRVYDWFKEQEMASKEKPH